MILQHKFAIAPMMDRTDRHCRYFHRQLTTDALLFSEMITADAIIHGDRSALLGFDRAEHPLVLQLGGSNPKTLATSAAIGADYGYDEINLNVGCPSSRVKSGSFGACLMLEPALVASCVAAIKRAVDIPVTVKCRLGVDDQDIEKDLDVFGDAVIDAGADGLWVHARKAWLAGLSPKENRTVPPLDYDRVHRLKRRLPGVFIGINGGIEDLETCRSQLDAVDGVMVGRAAYDRPAMLATVDRELYGSGDNGTPLAAIVEAMIVYAERQIAAGVPLGRVVRPMLGLFRGSPGARSWRQILTVGAQDSAAGADVIRRALEAVTAAGDASAADLAA
jgi:tRNA-dihydrouridine synthase A